MYNKLQVNYTVKSANDDIVNSRELYRKVLQIAISQNFRKIMPQCLNNSYIAKLRI